MDKLRNHFYYFIRTLSKIHLISVVNSEVFDNFPKHLPVGVMNDIESKMKAISENIKDGRAYLDKIQDKNLISFIQIIPELLTESEIDFQQVCLRQELITYFAYFESFMQDIWRLIYIKHPEFLPSDKEIKYSEITDKSSLEDLHEYIINKTLEKSGYDKLTLQIERLNNKPCLFKVQIKKEILNEINILLELRNMIIHNDSKITKEFAKLDDDKNLVVNQKFKITRQINDHAHLIIKGVAYEIYASVGSNLFEENKLDLLKDLGLGDISDLAKKIKVSKP